MSQPEIVISPRLLIRIHEKDGLLDEVVAYDENGNCEFHLEQMADFQWWMRWYSTKCRPLPRELIVNIGSAGGIQSFDPVSILEDEKHSPFEYQTPPAKIEQEVDQFIRYFGMKRLLAEMIAQTARVKQDENTNWPNRDTSYLDQLVRNLTTTLQEYEGRYPGEPNYEAGEPVIDRSQA